MGGGGASPDMRVFWNELPKYIINCKKNINIFLINLTICVVIILILTIYH
jgi:hypothetical protein